MNNVNHIGDVSTEAAQDQSYFNWNIFLFAIALTMIAVNWGFLRPASRQLDALQSQVTALRTTVEQLSGQQANAEQTTSIMRQLTEQGRIGREAMAALTSIRQVHDRLTHDVLKLASESRSLKSAMQDLTEVRAKMETALETLKESAPLIAEVDALNKRLINSAAFSQDARKGMETAFETLKESAPLIAEVDALNSQLMNSAAFSQEARKVAEGLLMLNEDLISLGDDTQKSQTTLDELISLRNQLEAESGEVSHAQTMVSELVSLKNDVLNQTSNMAAAIETLEQTNDLQTRFQRAAESFNEMRRWLTEVVMLEPTIEQAVRTLEPITELGNLRRMNADEIRQIAKAIRDGKLAQRSQSNFVPEVATARDLDNSPQ